MAAWWLQYGWMLSPLLGAVPVWLAVSLAPPGEGAFWAVALGGLFLVCLGVLGLTWACTVAVAAGG